jgi:alpha-methylacyl-CoA racemase
MPTATAHSHQPSTSASRLCLVNHPHNVARKTFVDVQGVMQPGPVPRFSRTKGEIKSPPPDNSDDENSVLKEWGVDNSEIEALKKADAI